MIFANPTDTWAKDQLVTHGVYAPVTNVGFVTLGTSR